MHWKVSVNALTCWHWQVDTLADRHIDIDILFCRCIDTLTSWQIDIDMTDLCHVMSILESPNFDGVTFDLLTFANKQISFENKWHKNICLYFLKCYFCICSIENKLIWFLTHMCKHSLFLINQTSRALISTTSVKRLLEDKTKVELRAWFCENYRKVLTFL